MKPVRLAKVSLVASIGLYALLVGYDNIVDYGSNYEFVRHVLLMDTTFPGNLLRDRAIESESLHRIAYALIIAVELICAVIRWTVVFSHSLDSTARPAQA